METRHFVRNRAIALTDPAASTTDLLLRASEHDPAAVNSIFPIVYAELRGVARLQLRGEDVGHTLTTTALVHEAYLRLVDQTRTGWSDRAHFLAIAATAMRRILVDHARVHRRQKRGGGLRREWLDLAAVPAPDRAELLVDLDEALDTLASLSPRQAKVVECRFFGGMTAEETAEALGIAVRTVKREWTKARSWLYQQLYPQDRDSNLVEGSD
jgi:RNA polymerase sigma factor (TIGR02999 family)